MNVTGLSTTPGAAQNTGRRTDTPGPKLLLKDELVLSPQASPDPVHVRRVVFILGQTFLDLPP